MNIHSFLGYAAKVALSLGMRRSSLHAHRIGPGKRTILNVRPSHAMKDENYYRTTTKPKHLRAT